MPPNSSLLFTEHISSTLHTSARIHSQHATNSLRGLSIKSTVTNFLSIISRNISQTEKQTDLAGCKIWH